MSENNKPTSEIHSLIEKLSPNSLTYFLNTINALLYALEIDSNKNKDMGA